MVDHFDPTELETKELLPKNQSDSSDYTEDTMADPKGVETRAVRANIQLPDWYYRKHALTDSGKPTYNQSVSEGIMQIFDAKFGTAPTFVGEETKVASEKEYFDSQINSVVDGISVLLEVDPQSTGYLYLQFATKTWAEFASVCYEYQDSMATQSTDDIPDWLVQREEKMVMLGRKARILNSAIEATKHDFGAAKVTIDRQRVELEVQKRLQRLAEWNFKQQADSSMKVKKELNSESAAYMENILKGA